MIGFETQGHGKNVVVMLHDWLGDRSNYEAARPYLSQTDFTWVFPDLRGYGSSRHVEGRFTLDEACADLLALVDGLGITQFSVVGHSMTGMIALRLALDQVQRVRKVVAAAPVTAGGLKLDDGGRAFFEKAVTDRATCREVVAAVTGGRYGAAWLDLKAQRAAETSTEAARLGYLRNMLLASDFSAELEGLTTPVLCITGAHDAEGFKEAAVRKALERSLPRLSVETVHEAGHYPMQESPVRFASLLQAFLA